MSHLHPSCEEEVQPYLQGQSQGRVQSFCLMLKLSMWGPSGLPQAHGCRPRGCVCSGRELSVPWGSIISGVGTAGSFLCERV